VVYAIYCRAGVCAFANLKRVAGRLFAPLGYSYILAILVSLLVSQPLTLRCVLPCWAASFSDTQDPPLIKRIKPLYKSLLGLFSAF